MEENNEIKNIISSYFFSLVNAILIIYSQLFIKSNDNQERYLKFKIILIIAIDSFSIIFQLIYQSTLNEIFYEIINTFLFSTQFYEFISFLMDIFCNFYKIDKNEIINPYLLSFVSYIINFPYHKFIYFHKVLIFVTQIISTSFSIIVFYYYLKNIISIISSDIKSSKIIVNNYISHMNNLCLLFFLIFNILKIASIFYNNNYYYDLISLSFYEVTKYTVFTLLINIISIISKNNMNYIPNIKTIDIANIK